MSNNTIFYTQIGSVIVFITALFVLYRVLVHQKDATIELLREKNSWLQAQVDQAKENTPDILAERLRARVGQFKEELEQLAKDYEANKILIQEKEKKLKRAEELLGELEFYKEQFGCPICGAELVTLAGDDVEHREYACGNTSSENVDYPCPHDPEFPTLNDYDLQMKQLSSKLILCTPKPKTRSGYKLTLQPQTGETEEVAIQKIKTNFERLLPKELKINQSAG